MSKPGFAGTRLVEPNEKPSSTGKAPTWKSGFGESRPELSAKRSTPNGEARSHDTRNPRLAGRAFRAIALFLLAALCFLPLPARACPSCFSASDAGTIDAYYYSALALALLPLGLVSAFVLVIGRARRAGDTASSERPSEP